MSLRNKEYIDQVVRKVPLSLTFSVLIISSLLIAVYLSYKLNDAVYEDGMIDGDIKESAEVALEDSITINKDIKKGDSFTSIMSQFGFTGADISKIRKLAKPHYDLANLKLGQQISLTLYPQVNQDTEIMDRLEELVVNISPISKLRVFQGEKGLAAEPVNADMLLTIKRAGGKINGSLHNSAKLLHIPDSIMAQVTQSLSSEVDFRRAIKAGDEIEILYEHKSLKDGSYNKPGKLLYVSLNTSGTKHKLYYFKSQKTDNEFFKTDGKTVNMAMFQNPLTNSRVTSPYGMRTHPILRYKKMHYGIDYGAPIGTPIKAAASGRIVKMGVNGAYGKVMQVKHDGHYQTLYAHISRFAKNIKTGSFVKKGEVIAFVGSSGRSTAPHLHFELRVDGKPVNPAKFRSFNNYALEGNELNNFKQYVAKLDGVLYSQNNKTEFALNELPLQFLLSYPSKRDYLAFNYLINLSL